VNNSQSLDKLCSQRIDALIKKYEDPEAARYFLIEAGIIDVNGDLMPPYRKPPEESEGALTEWKSEGCGVLFF